MNLYFHHVGRQGAQEDFRKTVFSDVGLSIIETGIPQRDPFRNLLLRDLRSKFPMGVCNCWGVPAGEEATIAALRPGDVVLLVESVGPRGTVPALCPVEVYRHHPLPHLSRLLWGSSEFPFVFFFRTERLSFPWQQMQTDLEYLSKFNPRRMFRVKPERLSRFGGATGYVRRLRRTYSTASESGGLTV